MSDETLEQKQQEMKSRNNRSKNATRMKKVRLEKTLASITGAAVRVEVLPPSGTNTPKEVKDVLTRLKTALQAVDSLTPEQVQEKVGSLTQILHVKLSLQVNEALDLLNSGDHDTAKQALTVIEKLMPFINQINELQVKMTVALGLAEGKGKLLPKRQPLAALPASTQEWEKSYGDTLTNKAIN